MQFLYGEDGLDIGKSQYLNEKGIPFLVDNRDCVRLAEVSVSDVCDQKDVDSAQKAVGLNLNCFVVIITNRLLNITGEALA